MPEPHPDIRVLLIEDNPGDARLTAEALRPFSNPGFRLEHRGSVGDGLERLRKGDLDVILSDLTLPDSLGGALLPDLVKAAGGIPVVVLTGSSDESSGLEVMQKGAQDYLLKGELQGRQLARALRFSVERRKAGEYLELLTKMKELEQTRSDFVSAVTHELRTPLVSLKGYTALLQKTLGQITPDEAQRMLSVIASNSSRLERLVNQVLTVAKMEKGRLALLREGVDLHHLAETCVRVMEGQARKHKFRLERRGRNHQAFCDPFQVEQVLLNLLSNAVKYWPQGGEILIRVEDGGQEVRVGVTDHGLGIPETERERIFRKFERIEDGSRMGIEGAGLGLYLAKEVIELHGGTMSLLSKVGEGTTVGFSLPRDGKADL